mmetsp:Transcript_22360/g.36960  ORF Transcript_22360/g.36960 Transcript_22360/m.36960 type:complete len:432 (-) Transcript_22360:250-1545(-)
MYWDASQDKQQPVLISTASLNSTGGNGQPIEIPGQVTNVNNLFVSDNRVYKRPAGRASPRPSPRLNPLPHTPHNDDEPKKTTTFVPLPAKAQENTVATITVMDYRSPVHEKRVGNKIADVIPDLTLQPGYVRWIDVDGLDQNALETLGMMYGLHSHAVEDALCVPQRPKADWYRSSDNKSSHCCLIATMMSSESGSITTEQVTLFLIGSTLITVQQGKPGDVFDEVRKRITNGDSSLPSGDAGYLMYSLLDGLVDESRKIVEDFGTRLEDLELTMMDNPTSANNKVVYSMKRDLIFVRRTILPLNEVFSTIMTRQIPDSPLHQQNLVYLKDVQDCLVNLGELIDAYQELATQLGELYTARQDQKRNEVMFVLTLMSSIFLPLTFVAGVYGMNYVNMPELEWELGYLYVWMVFIGVFVLEMFIFWRKKWLTM